MQVTNVSLYVANLNIMKIFSNRLLPPPCQRQESEAQRVKNLTEKQRWDSKLVVLTPHSGISLYTGWVNNIIHITYETYYPLNSPNCKIGILRTNFSYVMLLLNWFDCQSLHDFFYFHKSQGCICQNIHWSFPLCQLGLELGIMRVLGNFFQQWS